MKKIYLSSIILVFLSSQAFALDFDNLNISGFLSQGYLLTTDNNFYGNTQEEGTTDFYEYGVIVGARLSKRLQASVQMLAYTIGDTMGNNAFNVDLAFLRYSFSPYIGIQAGQMKCPHGFFNQTRDLDSGRMSIFLPTGTYSDRSRDTLLRCRGVGLFGRIPLKIAGELSLEYLFGEPDLDVTKGTVRGWEAMAPLANEVTEVNVDIEHNLHLMWDTPLEGLTLGGTIRFSDLTFTTHIFDPPVLPPHLPPIPEWSSSHFANIKVFKYGIKYEFYSLMVAAERYGVEYDSIRGEVTTPASSEAFYVMGQYQVLDKLGLGAFYDEYYPNSDDKEGAGALPTSHGWSKDICIFTRYDILENWLVKLEYHMFDGTALLLQPQNVDDDGNLALEEKWNLIAIKTTITF